jgi:putative sigma-54 modulation protein
VRQRVLDSGALEPEPLLAKPGEAPRAVPAAPLAPAIKVVREQTFTLRQMRVEDAVMQMNLLENDFFVFTDVDSHGVSVVYRRKDGNYGLIETGGRMPGS